MQSVYFGSQPDRRYILAPNKTRWCLALSYKTNYHAIATHIWPNSHWSDIRGRAGSHHTKKHIEECGQNVLRKGSNKLFKLIYRSTRLHVAQESGIKNYIPKMQVMLDPPQYTIFFAVDSRTEEENTPYSFTTVIPKQLKENSNFGVLH